MKELTKIRLNLAFLIILGVLSITSLFILPYLYNHQIILHFWPTKIMENFEKVSQFSLYALVVVFSLSVVVEPYLNRRDMTLSRLRLISAYIMLGATIISVNVHTFVWGFAVLLTFMFVIYSIIDALND